MGMIYASLLTFQSDPGKDARGGDGVCSGSQAIPARHDAANFGIDKIPQ
jgi:hypothetical protein